MGHENGNQFAWRALARITARVQCSRMENVFDKRIKLLFVYFDWV